MLALKSRLEWLHQIIDSRAALLRILIKHRCVEALISTFLLKISKWFQGLYRITIYLVQRALSLKKLIPRVVTFQSPTVGLSYVRTWTITWHTLLSPSPVLIPLHPAISLMWTPRRSEFLENEHHPLPTPRHIHSFHTDAHVDWDTFAYLCRLNCSWVDLLH